MTSHIEDLQRYKAQYNYISDNIKYWDEYNQRWGFDELSALEELISMTEAQIEMQRMSYID